MVSGEPPTKIHDLCLRETRESWMTKNEGRGDQRNCLVLRVLSSISKTIAFWLKQQSRNSERVLLISMGTTFNDFPHMFLNSPPPCIRPEGSRLESQEISAAERALKSVTKKAKKAFKKGAKDLGGAGAQDKKEKEEKEEKEESWGKVGDMSLQFASVQTLFQVYVFC